MPVTQADLDYAAQLANNHWEFVAALLREFGVKEEEIGPSKFSYIQAFVHGFKHAREREQKQPILVTEDGC